MSMFYVMRDKVIQSYRREPDQPEGSGLLYNSTATVPGTAFTSLAAAETAISNTQSFLASKGTARAKLEIHPIREIEMAEEGALSGALPPTDED